MNKKKRFYYSFGFYLVQKYQIGHPVFVSFNLVLIFLKLMQFGPFY